MRCRKLLICCARRGAAIDLLRRRAEKRTEGGSPPHAARCSAEFLLAVIGAAGYWFMTRNQESTDDAYTEGNAVSIAPKVSGYVVDNRINDNLVVHAGDLLLKIDPRDYIAAGDQARANLDSALVQLASAENDLEITRVRAPAKPLPQTPPIIGVGVPSTLARRRPDIRQAEAQLHAATAGAGVAVADFYPDISLTGNLGVRALDASYLTKWASLFYSVGPSISLPIFQGSRLTAGLRLARAQTEEVALHYRGTVLKGCAKSRTRSWRIVRIAWPATGRRTPCARQS